MADVEIYEDTINPFTIDTAKAFVRAHRNVFAKKTYRRVIYGDFSLIIVKEIETDTDGHREIWYWGFSPTKRGIIRNVGEDEAIEKLKRALS